MQQKENISPWLEQLDASVSFSPLRSVSNTCEVAVVGGGIAGVSTVFYLLKQTEKKVVLIEANQIARGATGHNAGQIVSYFERPFSTIVAEYGIQKAVAAQRDILNAWDLLRDVAQYAQMLDSLEIFTGYALVNSLEQLLHHLENKSLRDSHGVGFDAIYVDINWNQKSEIPTRYHSLITFVEPEFIQSKSESTAYFPILLASQKGCINSALLCQKTILKLLQEYPERLAVYEYTHVAQVELCEDSVQLSTTHATLIANEVVLCTNGYEHIQLVDKTHTSSPINTTFHKHIEGLVGYMAGFYRPAQNSTAISYFVPELSGTSGESSYFYLTRRKTHRSDTSLVVIGGPELFLEDTNEYRVETHNPTQAFADIEQFMNKYRTDHQPHTYRWHGLMGFTQTRLRYIGNTPEHPHVWYNLGCNGVGILSSIFGGWKIAQRIQGTTFAPSVFDPIGL